MDRKEQKTKVHKRRKKHERDQMKRESTEVRFCSQMTDSFITHDNT